MTPNVSIIPMTAPANVIYAIPANVIFITISSMKMAYMTPHVISTMTLYVSHL